MQQPNTAAAKQSKRVNHLKNTYFYYKNTLFSAVRCWIDSEKGLRVRMWRKEDLHAKFTTVSKISHKQFAFHICFLVDVAILMSQTYMPIFMSQTILDTSIKVIVKYAVNKVNIN